MNRRAVVLIVGIACAVLIFAVAGVAALVFVIFSVVDRTPTHVCGLAFVRRSPAAARLVGSPISQKGFTGGRSSNTNGELYERLTFNVRGSRGEAFVLSEGSQSPLGSHLTVKIGRDQRSETIYSGPLDCPELHERR